MIAYRGCPMEHGATARAQGVPNRRGGRGKCVENRKKILNSGNEPKNMLKTQELSFSGAKNELVFEGKRTQIKAKNMAKNARVDAGRPCSVPLIPPCGPSTAGSPCCFSAEEARATRRGGFAPLRSIESRVIPAKAGIQFVLSTWTPACAGVTKA